MEYRIALSVRKTSRRRARLTALRFAAGIWTATMLSVCVTEWGKGYVGRLRPNFAERCLGVSVQNFVNGDGQWPGGVPETLCSGPGEHDGRRSFPSGHAALAAGLGAYTQLWANRIPGIVPYVSGILVMTGGLWVGASRVFDGAHHVSDVVGGVVLGIWFSLVHFLWVQRETALAEKREESEAKQE